MRIGIFPVNAGREVGGLETYEQCLVRSLARLDKENQYHIFCLNNRSALSFRVDQPNVKFVTLRPDIRSLSVSISLPIEIRKRNIDFIHATFVPPVFSNNFVITIHDMCMNSYPNLYPRQQRWKRHLLVDKKLKKARHILCVSQTTMNLLSNEFAIPKERLSLVYSGIDPNFKVICSKTSREILKKTYGLTNPYILYVGQLRIHSKNIIRLLESFAELRYAHGNNLKLVLAGGKAWHSEDLYKTIDRLNLRDSVVQLGHIPGEHLPYLYNQAEVFVFPSLCEGFGFPVVEAMACGTPVVTSNISCLPEVAGGAALLVDPYSVEAITAGIVRILTEPALAKSLKKKGLERAKSFTWEQTAIQTLNIYKSKMAVNVK